jgi:hypothetical protein
MAANPNAGMLPSGSADLRQSKDKLNRWKSQGFGTAARVFVFVLHEENEDETGARNGTVPVVVAARHPTSDSYSDLGVRRPALRLTSLVAGKMVHAGSAGADHPHLTAS